jgi:uncharacterized protein YecE (DUF72 family)
MKLWVGTSGYSYKAWCGSFYPERLAAKEMLRFYASRLPAVEINNTFYRVPNETVVQSWAAQVSRDFRFVLKAPQKITHVKRLRDVSAEVEYFFRVGKALGSASGACLVQLPPRLQKDIERLKAFLALVPQGSAVAFEFRHPSWFDDEVLTCLRTHNCPLVISETDESHIPNVKPTATWGYLRLRRSDYDSSDLARWKQRVLSQDWDHAYVFFKHEDEGIGPKLAADFLKLNVPV